MALFRRATLEGADAGRSRGGGVARRLAGHAAAWAALWRQAEALDLARQKALVDPLAADKTAAWLRDLIARSWGSEPRAAPQLHAVAS